MFRIPLNNNLFLLIVDAGQPCHRTPLFDRVEQFARLMLVNKEMTVSQSLYLIDRLERLHCLRVGETGAIVSSELCSLERLNWFKKQISIKTTSPFAKVGDTQ